MSSSFDRESFDDEFSSSSSSSSTEEIPFWVGGAQKWISGISSTTTCGDVVKALLKSDVKYNRHCSDILSKFVLVERWRKVEKPLRSDSKILKIFKAWGQEISDVKFVVKRLHSRSDHRIRSLRRTDSKLWRQTQIGSTTDTVHPKCLSESEDERPLPPKVEKLIKTILAQGETIQSQLLKLSSAASKSSKVDKDYVLHQYLDSIPEDETCNVESDLKVSGKGENDEANISFLNQSNSNDDDLSLDDGSVRLWTELFEKLVSMNHKLESQEEELIKLSSKMQRYLDPESFIDSELKSANDELADMADLNSRLGREIRRNELALGHMVKNYDGRRVFANCLEMDVNRAESRCIKLRKELADCNDGEGTLQGKEKCVRFDEREQILTTPEPQPPPLLPLSTTISTSGTIKKSILKTGETTLDSGDSNSDTGLSSMHSSSSEDGSSPVTSYGLDTLV